MGLDEENEKVRHLTSSSNPMHTRLARFGTVFVTANNEVYEVDARDILCGFVQELDNRNLVLSESIDRAQFMMEMYVTNILGITINDPSDLISTNDVEGLTENNELNKLTQQYTIYPIWDLYKLNLNEWLDQPPKNLEFQLKMAMAYKAANTKTELLGEEDEIVMDETHRVERATLVEDEYKPKFKRQF